MEPGGGGGTTSNSFALRIKIKLGTSFFISLFLHVCKADVVVTIWTEPFRFNKVGIHVVAELALYFTAGDLYSANQTKPQMSLERCASPGCASSQTARFLRECEMSPPSFCNADVTFQPNLIDREHKEQRDNVQ